MNNLSNSELLDKILSTSLKTATAETTIPTMNSLLIAIHSIKCFEMQDTNEKLRLTCGVTQRIATDHVRVPSPMIGQYTLDLRVNSIRDSGALERSNTTSRRGAVVQWLARPLVTPAAGVCSPDQAHY